VNRKQGWVALIVLGLAFCTPAFLHARTKTTRPPDHTEVPPQVQKASKQYNKQLKKDQKRQAKMAKKQDKRNKKSHPTTHTVT
jgi:hypothetical protein